LLPFSSSPALPLLPSPSEAVATTQLVFISSLSLLSTNPYLFFERTTAGEAPTVSNLLNQKEPTVQKRQNKKQQQRRKQVA